MATISLDPRLGFQTGKTHHQHGAVTEEVEGIIRIYKDGHVERPPLVPTVSCAVSPELSVAAKDVIIEKFTNLWARLYVPSCPAGKLPLVVYFHGGGFCVGSAAWSCYHDFLSNLASKASAIIVSVNYRLAPENRLPAAYEDGLNAVIWLKQQAMSGSQDQIWWSSRCNLSSVFLAGDSAGANIAHNVAARLGSLRPLCLKGTILIQPFFGGESRTESEKHAFQPAGSALTLPASDAYWRLSLPVGANRDHNWCNPIARGGTKAGEFGAVLVCISDMDILKDRNLEFCSAMAREGKRVEKVIYKGVGHAFQVLNNSQLSQARKCEMMNDIKAFIHQ
ncbi:probable carboxylesterase 17 [Rhododendron vialii]|uniref:probable carboxylesterase 17 n=1 Tax=Rhododendron vialii TaxID=182163 RepID=UPI0026600B61|nr:probable carboxylesterase 17 [Rhododendron vialii]